MKRALGLKLFFVALVVAISLSTIVYRRSARQDEYHTKVVALMSEISEHRNQEEVRRLLSESRFQGLTLRQDSSKDWEVETPIEFGATNWVLYMEISDSRVVALRVRTADSAKDHPVGAPPDKNLPD